MHVGRTWQNQPGLDEAPLIAAKSAPPITVIHNLDIGGIARGAR
jgi:hypothetical protein